MMNLKDNKGSALLLVVITMAILTTLGIAIVSLSTMNYKMKKLDENAKKTFYYAESGIEQAYAMTGQEVQKAVLYAKNNTDTYIKNFVQAERNKEIDPLNPTNSAIILPTDGIDPYGEVDGEQLKTIANEQFKKEFKQYFNNGNNQKTKSLIDKLDDENNYSAMSVTEIKIIDKDVIKNKKWDDDKDSFTIKLKSKFKDKKISRTIQADIVMSVPDFNVPLENTTNIISLPKNPIWQKAFVSEKDIKINGDVSVKGDVYSYGTKPSDEYKIENFGGILAENNSSFKVNGDIITNSLVQTKGQNAVIQVNDGSIFCNSLVTQKSAYGSRIITNDGNVYALDDIELNADSSRITIDGSYFGYSNGRIGTSHDKSSSIVINSNDLGVSSFLTITGNQTSGDYVTYIKEGKEEMCHGVMLGGTSYIRNENYKYQTGESISVKGNYLAYTNSLENVFDIDSLVNDTVDENKYKDVSFSKYGDYYFVDKFKNGNNAFTQKDYKNYFLLSINDNDIKNSIILKGVNIPKDKVLYCLGDYLAQDNKYYGDRMGLLGSFVQISSNLTYDFQYLIHRMEKRYNSPALTDTSTYQGIDYYFNFDKLNEDSYTVGDTQNKVYVSKNQNEKIYILGKNTTEPVSGTKICSNNGKLSAVIIAKGDVYIRGQLDFKGTIITKGNIIIEDNNKKTFKYDEKYVVTAIRNNPKIRRCFDNHGTSEVVKFVDVGNSNVGMNQSNNIFLKYSDLISIKNWSLIE